VLDKSVLPHFDPIEQQCMKNPCFGSDSQRILPTETR
jgi:hypothetical protein